MLKVERISKTFAGPEGVVRAVEGVSVCVGAGEFVAVRGHSGCGKSTLLLAAGGLQRPEEGTVEVCGEDVYAMSAEQRARFRAGHVGFVFQRFHLVPYLNVIENVMAPGMAIEIADARERAEELIERLGMGERRGHFPAQLSTGERQRVALARALLARPKLLLADEPTGNLDPENASIVLDYLGEFAKGGGAVLLVTHDGGAAERAGRVVYMRKGLMVDS